MIVRGSQVLRLETGVAGDAGEHVRADLNPIVESEHIVGQPARSSILCEPACRLIRQPIPCRAPRTTFALRAPH